MTFGVLFTFAPHDEKLYIDIQKLTLDKMDVGETIFIEMRSIEKSYYIF